jgi:hypothetical protein
MAGVVRKSTVVAVLAGVLCLHIAVGAAIWSSSSGAETVWFHLGRWLTGVQDSDSWKPIEAAYAEGDAHRPGIYDTVFFQQRVKFQYPLTAVTLFGGLSRASLNAVSWLAVAFTAILCAALAGAAVRDATAADGASPAVELLTAIAVLSFYPVLKAYSLGQVQTVVTLLAAAMLLAWQRKRPTLAGLALGAMLLIKPAAAPLLVWGALRGQWRLIGGAVAVALLGIAISAVTYPPGEQLGYLRVLAFIGARGEVFRANQSVNGLLNRLVASGGSLTWQADTFAEPSVMVRVGTAAGLVLLVGAALWLVPRPARGGVADLSAMMLAATIGSPVAWEHHYGVLAPILAATVPAMIAARPHRALVGLVLAGAILVSANFFQAANRFDGTPLNPLQSYLFFSALVIEALLVRTSPPVAA